MKYTIVHITPPPQEGIEHQQKRQAYIALLQKIESLIQPRTDMLRLGESVWQIPIEHSLPILAAMCQGCQAQQLHIRALFLEDPEWISIS